MPSAKRSLRDQVLEIVQARLGLKPLSSGAGDLDSFVRSEAGGDPDAYLGRLRNGPLWGGPLERLVAKLTIGETFFFRDQELFAVIRDELLPRRLRAHGGEQPPRLRLLSAGCATGEEAYTLAWLASGSAFRSVDVSVLGLDVNRGFIERARQGCYGDWSLRGAPSAFVVAALERDGKQYRVRPALREHVRFQPFNLAADPLPAPALGVMGLDLILCRNVLLYFEPPMRMQVANALSACLADGGYLVLGPADLHGDLPGCELTELNGVFVHRRRTGSTVHPPPPAALPELTSSVPVAPKTLNHARERADEGDLGGALEDLEVILKSDPENREAYVLKGLLSLEVGALDAARASFRSALYLDNDDLLAHVGVALLGQRTGRPKLVERHVAQVRRLAVGSEDQPVEGWEGMTVGRLLMLFGDDA